VTSRSKERGVKSEEQLYDCKSAAKFSAYIFRVRAPVYLPIGRPLLQDMNAARTVNPIFNHVLAAAPDAVPTDTAAVLPFQQLRASQMTMSMI